MHEFHCCQPNPELSESYQWRLLNDSQAAPCVDRPALFAGFAKMAAESLKSMRVVEFAVIKEQLEEDGGDDFGMDCVESFARRMAYSHVILLASIFDNVLDRACKTLAQAEGNAAMGRLAGKTMRRRYLERLAHCRMDAAQWDAAVLLSALRKVLVEGPSLASPHLLARLGEQNGLRVESHEVLVEPAYVQCVYQSLKQLIDAIRSALEKTAVPRQQERTCRVEVGFEHFFAKGLAYPRWPALLGGLPPAVGADYTLIWSA